MKELSRREFLEFLAAGAAAGALPTGAAATARAVNRPQPTRPNIIFIMADDLGTFDLGCYGQKKIRTPNIDRIAAEGVKFTQCYSGSTVCAPSRSVLMTGLHTGHTTVRGNFSAAKGGRVPLNAEDVTVAEVLKTAGYATGIVGKWGLGEPDTAGIPNRQGFDFWFGYLNQRHAHNYWTDYLWRNQQKVIVKDNIGGKRGQYSHDLMTAEALDFVRRSKDGPFFLYLAYTIPHGKIHPPDDKPYTDRPWTPNRKKYAAMITRMDRDVGRLMALLKKLGLDENTVVFFTSDNGPTPSYTSGLEFFGSAGPFRGQKGNLYEGGIRVPMIVRWPGKTKPRTVSDQVWAFWDFLPTAAEIAGAKPPAKLDGISMLPAILGRKQARQHELLYWEFRTRGFSQAARMGDWKAVRQGTKEPLELYDLKADPGEKNNVAQGHPGVVARIEKSLATIRTESVHWPSLPGRRTRAKKA